MDFKKEGIIGCFLLVIFLLGIPIVFAADNYPWINTGLYENIKQPGSYSVAEANFVADHYDIAVAHLQDKSQIIKQRNPNIDILPFTGLAYISTSEQLNIPEFFNLNTQYTTSEKESIYLHYKCDVPIGSTLYKGCNLENAETGRCTGTSAQGCTSSSASWLYESRVPDPDPTYRASGWLMPNYNDVYKDYGVWRIKKIFNYYNPLAAPDGIFWDNILYLGSSSIDKTIEYWGQQDIWGQEHQRNRDYNNYFLSVKQEVENELNKPLIWMGNVNGMYWIRSYPGIGPYTTWVLNNLNYYTPESWVSPISRGEQNMPSWDYECYDMREAWEYSNNGRNHFFVMTYNFPFEGSYPDERTKIFSIAKYYLVKNSYLYYGYSDNGGGENLVGSEWNKMAEVNLGMPHVNPSGIVDFYGSSNTNRFFDWNNKNIRLDCSSYNLANVVVARYYDNGLVIARWKGNRCSSSGPECNSYVDPINYDLDGSYYFIQADGSISGPVNSVVLRTNEGALLLNACSEGEVIGTCGCDGVILNDGDFCGDEIPYCGDDECNGDETCLTCPLDCGACPGTCGDGNCDNSESCETCEQDCGICNVVYQCNDDIDNDNDGFVDYPLDSGCVWFSDNNESDPISPPIGCTNNCDAGGFTCLTDTSFSRCGYLANNCLTWTGEINCPNDYVCDDNAGCVLENNNIIGDGGVAVYALGALAVIMIGFVVWIISRKLFVRYDEW
ncbi:MAG: hypothetical protein ABIH25_04820 [Candidatus Woesearchaeota archaeon]